MSTLPPIKRPTRVRRSESLIAELQALGRTRFWLSSPSEAFDSLPSRVRLMLIFSTYAVAGLIAISSHVFLSRSGDFPLSPRAGDVGVKSAPLEKAPPPKGIPALRSTARALEDRGGSAPRQQLGDARIARPRQGSSRVSDSTPRRRGSPSRAP